MAEDGSIALRAMIGKLRELDGMVERSAPRVARAVEREIVEGVRRQSGPNGSPWPPTADGRPALQGIASALRVRAMGSRVLCVLEGHYARHHFGAVKGGKKRPILPTGGMPDPMTRAIAAVVGAEWERTMGGAP